MAKQYHKTDFSLLITVGATYSDQFANVVPITTSTPFNFRFFHKGGSAESSYLASSDGNGQVSNCKIIDSKHVLVFFDYEQYRAFLSTGAVLLEAEFILDDVHYESDSKCNVKRLYSTGVELTTDVSDSDTGIDMVMPVYDLSLLTRLRGNVDSLLVRTSDVESRLNEVEDFIDSITMMTSADVRELQALV